MKKSAEKSTRDKKMRNFFSRKDKKQEESIETTIAENEVVEDTTAQPIEEEETEELVPVDEVVEEQEEKEPFPPLPDEDETAYAKRGVGLIQDIVTDADNRILGSEGEKQTANYLLNKTEEVLKIKGRLEPFYVKSFAYNYGLLIVGGLLLLSLILFAIEPISAFLINITAVSLLIFRVWLKYDIIGVFDKKSVSYNVVNEIKSEEITKNTLILTSNYSSGRNWNYSLKINVKAFNIVSSVLLSLELISMMVLAFGVKNVGLQVVVGLLLGVMIIICTSFYGYQKQQGKNVYNGLGGVATTFAVVDYLNKHRELIGKNTSVVFCAFGGGIDGINGTKAFIKEHFKVNNDYDNAISLNIEGMPQENIALYLDFFGKDNDISSKVYESLNKKVSVVKERGLIKGCGTTFLNKVGVKSVGVGNVTNILPYNLNNNKDNVVPSEDEAQKQFDKCLEVVKDLLADLDAEAKEL